MNSESRRWQGTFLLDCRHFGRAHGGNIEPISASYATAWSEAESLLANTSILLPFANAAVAADWSLARSFTQSAFDERWDESAVEVIERGDIDALFKAFARLKSDRPLVTVPIKVVIEGNFPDTHVHVESTAAEVARRHCHDVFLLMNLSAPGSANFRVATLRGTRSESTSKIGLDAGCWESAWHDAISAEWPKVRLLEIPGTWQWLQRVVPDTKQLATHGARKALWCLLHASRREFVEPDATIWLAHALESLFETGPGTPRSVLSQRISRVLGANRSESQAMRKSLTEFYDLRNAFAHGGLAIAHPLECVPWEQELMPYTLRLLTCNAFAFRFILATVQTMIQNNWSRLSFVEDLAPVGAD